MKKKRKSWMSPKFLISNWIDENTNIGRLGREYNEFSFRHVGFEIFVKKYVITVD